jgi:hypothetical protein
MTTLTKDEAYNAYIQRLNEDATYNPHDFSFFSAGYDAAMSALNAEEDKHIVEVTPTGWTMMHPTMERLGGDLFACAYNHLVPVAIEERHLTEGKFRVYLDQSGVLLWDEVDG